MNGERALGPAVRLVAGRELRTRLRSRSFVVGTAISLVVLVGFVLVGALATPAERVSRIGLNGQAIAVAAPLTDAAGQLGLPVRTSEVTDLAAGREQVRDGTLDALVSGAPAALTVLVRGELDPDLRGVLDRIVQHQVLSGLLAAVEELDADEVLGTVAVTGVDVRSLGLAEQDQDGRLGLGLVVVALLYAALLAHGAMVAGGIAEERTHRVAELLGPVVGPGRLLAGTVAGIGLVGLVQLGVVGAVGLVLVLLTGGLPVAGATATLAWALVWYLLGYPLYAVGFAMAGSLVTHRRSVPVVLVTVVAVLAVAFVLGVAVLATDPAGVAATVLSLLPPVAPLLMPGRIALAAVPFWQVAVAVGLTVAAIVPLARLADAVYRSTPPFGALGDRVPRSR